MKYIKKKSEPPELIEWKATDKMYRHNQPRWKRLRPPAKDAVHAALCEEQGGICCYCGVGVELDTSHIEHFQPREYFPEMQFDHKNLLCSCQRELQKEEPRHCGNAKGSWFKEGITVSPLDPGCETRFEYFEDGRIRAVADDEGARKTLCHLDLDNAKLRELRKAAINAALDDIDILQDGNIQESMGSYLQRSPINNRFQPFCMAIVQCMKSLLG